MTPSARETQNLVPTLRAYAGFISGLNAGMERRHGSPPDPGTFVQRCIGATVRAVSGLKKTLRVVALGVVLLVGTGFGYVTWRIANPTVQNLPLPQALISDRSEAGQVIRGRATERADLDSLDRHFEAQRYATYCGVASSVIALNALRASGPGADALEPLTQTSFFDGLPGDVRGGWATFYTGMSLAELGTLLTAHGAHVDVVHAGTTDLDSFRRRARENLGRAGDFVLINYQRSVIGQKPSGHISPLGAYDEATDRFLVLDVSTYKYPPVWVKADVLFDAMNTRDNTAGATRGFVLVGLS